MTDRHKCPTCGLYVAGYVPRGGDGTAVRLFRHGPDSGCPDRSLILIGAEPQESLAERLRPQQEHLARCTEEADRFYRSMAHKDRLDAIEGVVAFGGLCLHHAKELLARVEPAPTCPDCGSAELDVFGNGPSLICLSCHHAWQPEADNEVTARLLGAQAERLAYHVEALRAVMAKAEQHLGCKEPILARGVLADALASDSPPGDELERLRAENRELRQRIADAKWDLDP